MAMRVRLLIRTGTRHQLSSFITTMTSILLALSFVSLGAVFGHSQTSSTAAFTTHHRTTTPTTNHCLETRRSGMSITTQHRQSNFMGRGMLLVSPPNTVSKRSNSGTALGSFLGNDGGILGIGAPEVAVTLLVGYFILGPSDLYKLVKEIGKVFQSVRTLGTEATKTFENSMENNLEMEELRNAQRELNSAFSFRRSINQDDVEDNAFANRKADTSVEAMGGVAVGTSASASASASAADDDGTTTATAPKKKRKKRRRVKKATVEEQPAGDDDTTPSTTTAVTPNIPDLSMTDAFSTPEEQASWEAEMDAIQRERTDRLKESGETDWFNEPTTATYTDDVLSPPETTTTTPTSTTTLSVDEQSRFASQMTDDWNKVIMDNENKLSPLGQIMERLAILEEEKDAADRRLEEEFRLRAELEEKFYKEKRKLLEESAVEVQAEAYADMTTGVMETAPQEQK